MELPWPTQRRMVLLTLWMQLHQKMTQAPRSLQVWWHAVFCVLVKVHTLSGVSAFLEGLVVVSTCLALPQGLGCLSSRAACACELLHILPSYVSANGN
jgi:hypothetical protein